MSPISHSMIFSTTRLSEKSLDLYRSDYRIG